ncbi:MAG: hypothetical protein IJZ94_01160 [Clostridia bacterium]|nr:hypothetical protein [Clostridia bacterium]
MFEFIKISIAGIVLAVLIILFKNIKSEYSVMVSIAGCCIILASLVSAVSDVFGFVKNLLSEHGINSTYLEIILKVCGISFICNFAAETCRDSGAGAVAVTVETAGRICIVATVMPLALSLTETVSEIIKSNVF